MPEANRVSSTGKSRLAPDYLHNDPIEVVVERFTRIGEAWKEDGYKDVKVIQEDGAYYIIGERLETWKEYEDRILIGSVFLKLFKEAERPERDALISRLEVISRNIVENEK